METTVQYEVVDLSQMWMLHTNEILEEKGVFATFSMTELFSEIISDLPNLASVGSGEQ